MKFVFIAALFLVFDAKVFASSKLESSKSLSKKQANKILSLIKTACVDAWCVGEYDFSFKSLTKNSKADGYTLSFKMKRFTGAKWSVATCEFKNRSAFSSYVKKVQLKDDFYQELSECVTDAASESSGVMLKTDLYGNRLIVL